MKTSFLILLSSVLVIVFVSCNGTQQQANNADNSKDSIEATALLTNAQGLFGTIANQMPGSENDSPELIELGKKLYFDVRLSENDKQSCNTCHLLDAGKFGVDNKSVSEGVKGKNGVRNSPTVLDAGFQFAQFWDGRANNLKEQAKGPILNTVEMAMPNEKMVVAKISVIDEYKEMFTKAYPSQKAAISWDNIANAIAAFERTLITHNRFDDFVKGDWKAINADERKGLETFINTGCTICHITPLLGGNMYQKTGLVHAYENTKDLGRYDVTKSEQDKFMFKVSMLRNVAETSPYFHDGAVASLDSAIVKMAWLQLGKNLTAEETGSIKVFLASLTDESRKK